MSIGFKIKKFLISFVTTISVIITIVTVLWMALFHLYLVPKFGFSMSDMMTGSDVVQITKYVINGNLVDNLRNFDKDTAKDVLGVLLEIDAESSGDDMEIEDYILAGSANVDLKKIVPKAEVKKMIEDAGIDIGKREESAYERIMAAATKEEINTGIAILSKLDLAKLKKLHAANDKKGISDYLLSKLTRKEINTGVKLYEKYKHLL